MTSLPILPASESAELYAGSDGAGGLPMWCSGPRRCISGLRRGGQGAGERSVGAGKWPETPDLLIGLVDAEGGRLPVLEGDRVGLLTSALRGQRAGVGFQVYARVPGDRAVAAAAVLQLHCDGAVGVAVDGVVLRRDLQLVGTALGGLAVRGGALSLVHACCMHSRVRRAPVARDAPVAHCWCRGHAVSSGVVSAVTRPATMGGAAASRRGLHIRGQDNGGTAHER